MIPGTREVDGRVELTEDLSASPLCNPDLAPATIERRTRLELPELYRADGMFRGVNFRTVLILVVAILPNVPGFLSTVGVRGVPELFKSLFDYAWFVGFAIAFGVYSLWKPTRTSSTANG